MAETSEVSLLELAADLTAAWLANPNTRASAEDVPAFLQSIHRSIASLEADINKVNEPEPAQEYTPAVTPRRSLASPDHIISLIDGKPYKSLKRHLSGHGLTPQQYRERYNLKADYPMVAPSYAERRRALAKEIGLGRKPGQRPGKKLESDESSDQSQTAAAPAPAKRKRAQRTKLAVEASTHT